MFYEVFERRVDLWYVTGVKGQQKLISSPGAKFEDFLFSLLDDGIRLELVSLRVLVKCVFIIENPLGREGRVASWSLHLSFNGKKVVL